MTLEPTMIDRTTLVTRPLSQQLGAEILGLDLEREIDEATRRELLRIWTEAGLILVRGVENGEQHPRRWAEAKFNIARWTVMPKGGHFPAMEVPDLFIGEVRAFFRDYRSGTGA